jgi:hypothetical protein
MEAGPCHVHVLMPATPVDQLEPHLGSQDLTKGEPKASAEELLRLRRLGAEVDGEVGEPDPVAAIRKP